MATLIQLGGQENILKIFTFGVSKCMKQVTPIDFVTRISMVVAFMTYPVAKNFIALDLSGDKSEMLTEWTANMFVNGVFKYIYLWISHEYAHILSIRIWEKCIVAIHKSEMFSFCLFKSSFSLSLTDRTLENATRAKSLS